VSESGISMANLLLLENDTAICKGVGRVLKGTGHSFHWLRSPQGLLKRLHDPVGGPALILASPKFYPKARTAALELEHPVPVILVTDEKGLGLISFAETGPPDDLITIPLRKREFLFRISRVLDTAAKFRELSRQQQDFRKVIDIAASGFSMVEPGKVLHHIVKELADNMPVFRCSIVSVDEKKKQIDILSTHENYKAPDLRLELGKYPEIHVACRKKKPVVVKDVNVDPLTGQIRSMLADRRIRSIMVVPITSHHKVFNHLFLRASSTTRPFSDSEIQFVQELSRASANAIHRAFVFEKLEGEKRKFERMAATDALTGLYNLRYLGKRLDQEFSRAIRHALPLSCMMVDLDNFKEINDRYGHKCGDGVLVEFAQLLEENFRKSDIVGRYGGDEFIVLMPQSDVSGAVIEAERLVRRVSGHRFRSLKKGLPVSVSVGFASYPNNKMKAPSDLVACADRALLDAKKQGRNQIAIYH